MVRHEDRAPNARERVRDFPQQVVELCVAIVAARAEVREQDSAIGVHQARVGLRVVHGDPVTVRDFYRANGELRGGQCSPRNAITSSAQTANPKYPSVCPCPVEFPNGG